MTTSTDVIDTANAAFRDYETDGVPASGAHKVKKQDVRSLFGTVAAAIDAAGGGGSFAYATVAALNADLAHDANTKAEVYNDPSGNVTNGNGVWTKVGASGVGSWTWLSPLSTVETETRLDALEAIDAGSRLTALEADDVYRQQGLIGLVNRPGETPLLFSDAVAGIANDMVPTALSQEITATGGSVLRVTGAETLAARGMFKLETGRKYYARAIVARNADPADPNNHAVRLMCAWFDQNKTQLSSPASAVLVTVAALTVASGRTEMAATIGTEADPVVNIVAPAGALYGRVFVQTYGADGSTDFEVISQTDVTDSIGDAIAETLVQQAIAASTSAQTYASAAAASATQAEGAAASAGSNLWVRPVISVLNAPPGSPTAGDRYLVGTAPSGAWASNPNQVAEWNGSAWAFSGAPTDGQQIYVQSTQRREKWINAGLAWFTLASKLVFSSDFPTLAAADAFAVAAGMMLIIDQAITLGADTTLSAKIVKVLGGTITTGAHAFTCNGEFTAPRTAIVFDAAGAGAITLKGSGRQSACWFGAVGDDTTDNKNALTRWQTCLDASVSGTSAMVGELPCDANGGEYGTSGKIPWYGDIIGDGSNVSSIVALAGFTDNFVIDFNFGTLGKRIQGVTIDLRPLSTTGTVTAFGSSSTYGANGSSEGQYDDLTILSNELGTPALKCIATPGHPETWMFTGAWFKHLQVIAPICVDLEIGDDIVMEVPRFQVLDGGTAAGIEFGVTDVKATSLYCFWAHTTDAAAAAFIAGQDIDLDGYFMEGSHSFAWMFQYPSGDLLNIKIRRGETNLTMNSANADKAWIRANVTGAYQRIVLDDLTATSGSIPCSLIFSLFNTISSSYSAQVLLEVKGCDEFTTLAKAAAGGLSNSNTGVRILGTFLGVFLQHDFTIPAGGNSYVGHGTQIAIGSTY